MLALVGVWRRSLRTRVVTKTVLLSVVIIGIVGWILLGGVADGLAENRRDSAVDEARAGFVQAQLQLDAAVESSRGGQSQTLTQVIDSLAATRGDNRNYELILHGPLMRDERAPVRASGSVGIEDLPDDLVEQVSADHGIRWQYADISIAGDDSAIPVVVVGSRLTVPASGENYGLFYVFSMADQQETLGLVRRALAFGGLMLVILVTAVGLLITRQVVDPLREARRVAERFASGDFEQRMNATGEDDIARLSLSFNQMAQNLQSQIRRLQNLSRLQQRFVSDVSHELRTPLTTVQMAAQLLNDLRHDFPPHAARAVELLSTELTRFETLLSDLLDLSRFDAGAATLELRTVDLAAVAREAVRDDVLIRSEIRARTVGARHPILVEADIRRVQRIIRNLVANAVKYSGSDRLDIVLRSDDVAVSLAVRDHGAGLEPEQLQRVFQRFWRADPARSQGGTGLGLAIAREDALLHGGMLDVWSKPERGTEFILTLPLRHGDRVQEPVLRSVFV